METDLYTLPEAAKMLRVSRRTLEREITDGRLSAISIRSRKLVTRAALDAYLAASVIEVVPWQSANTVIAGKSEYRSEVELALKKLSRPVQVAPTRKVSKLRFANG